MQQCFFSRLCHSNRILQFQFGGAEAAPALVDGEDILMPICSVPPLPWGEGLLRMRRKNGDWQPVQYTLVTSEPGTNPPMFSKPYPNDGLSGCECFAVQIASGALQFTCREWGTSSLVA